MSRIALLLILAVAAACASEPQGSNPPPPPLAALRVTTTSLPTASPAVAYRATLLATGGDGNYTWSVIVGSLPTGLSLNTTTGEISGTPTGATSTFTAQVASGDGQTFAQQLTITMSTTVVVTTTTLSDGVEAVAYSQTLAATGGDGNYTWSVTLGALPTGLSLNASTGNISGTPTAVGTETITVQVVSGNGQTAVRQLAITIHATLVVTSSSLPDAATSVAYSATLMATGGDVRAQSSPSSGSRA